MMAVFMVGWYHTVGAAPEISGESLSKTMTDETTLSNVEVLQGPGSTEPEVAPPNTQTLSGDFWNMDEIRKTPFDTEVVATKTEKDYKVEGLYITSRVAPQRPDRIYFSLAQPVKPAEPLPVFIDLTGGGNDMNRALWMAHNLGCAVADIEWRKTTAVHRSQWGDENRSMWVLTGQPADNFSYRLVMAIRRVIDYLVEQPGIDPERIACGGGSMGGYYSLFVAGVDPRIACVAATYGTGAGAMSQMRSQITRGLVEHFDPVQRNKWIQRYDPITYAPQTRAKVYMYLAANDFFFWPDDTIRNFNALPGEKRMLIVPNFNHNAAPFQTKVPKNPMGSWLATCLQHGKPFPDVTTPILDGRTWSWQAASPEEFTKCTLYWSPGNVSWPSRYWLALPATRKGNSWFSEVPLNFAAMQAQVYVTITDTANRSVSSGIVSHQGSDPHTTPGPLWPGGALWDEQTGAAAWRPTCVMVHQGPEKNVVESSPPRGLKVGPAQGNKAFSLITNSIILASGNADRYKGIRLIVDGSGQPGRLTVSFLKESGCPDVIEYAATLDYGAGLTTIDLAWNDFVNDKYPSTPPYPFDALRIDGQRPDASTITIHQLTLRP